MLIYKNMIITNTIKEFFNTSENKIYAEFNNVPVDEQSNRKGILFIGANPQWPGSENNKIMNEMFYEFAKKNYCVMKIIFRPYESALFKKHEYEDIKYIRDASIAVDCFFSKFNCVKYFIVIGYSWGGSIALNLLLRRPEISSFILISPTLALKQCDFVSCLSVFKTQGLIIHGRNDQITNLNTLNSYVKLLQSKKINLETYIVEKADHYYNEGFREMVDKVEDYINNLNPLPKFQINNTAGISLINEKMKNAIKEGDEEPIDNME